ncbi:MAG: CHAD domain-containing protein [Acidobacteriia bacterium]|nr:CHAD domain-containing protein [Terriglobia bacterium]
MERAASEMDGALAELAPDPVHDLRVALRRCRSIASSFRTIDFHPAWRRMDRAARTVFRQLGELRDVQILAEWVKKLGAADDPVTATLMGFCTRREMELRAGVTAALTRFNRTRWQYWSERLSARFERVPAEGLVFQCLALHRYADAYELHRAALRNRTKVAYHQLRIGLKKFRYLVENFLPERHRQWGKSLKELQDLLGEVHDLDVLWATALKQRAFASPEARQRWQERIEAERSRRLARYRELMMGRESLWRQWRRGLPQGAAIRRAEHQRLKTWAAFLDPDFEHSHRVAKLAVQLHKGLVRANIFDGSAPAALLESAALLHDVGRSSGGRSRHKASRRLISRMVLPAGWTQQDLQIVALTARYHRGALPSAKQKRFAALPPKFQQCVRQMAAVVRLADAFDCRHDGAVRSLSVQRAADRLIVEATGFSEEGAAAERVAAGRYLLERTCGLPVLVQGVQLRSRRTSTR